MRKKAIVILIVVGVLAVGVGIILICVHTQQSLKAIEPP